MSKKVYCNCRDKRSDVDVFCADMDHPFQTGDRFQFPTDSGVWYKVVGILTEKEENGKKYISFWVEQEEK